MGATITWTGLHPASGKYLPPQNPDGTPHRCKEYAESTAARYPVKDTGITVHEIPEDKYAQFLEWCKTELIPVYDGYRAFMPGELSNRFQVLISDITCILVFEGQHGKSPLAKPKTVTPVTPDDSDFSPEKPT